MAPGPLGPSAPKQRVVLYGNLCLDQVCEVADYPEEDSSQRALASRRSLGGNGGNSSRVLAQLRGARSHVSWMGPVPRTEGDPDTAFALAELGTSGVDTSLLEEVGGQGLPTSFILSSRRTGSRTIVSTRNGVRELGAQHVAAAARRVAEEAASTAEQVWCHLECRQEPAVILRMAEAWAEACGPASAMSLEVEKASLRTDAVLPLLGHFDHVLFSRDFVEAQLAEEPPEKRQRRADEEELPAEVRDHAAPRFLRHLCDRARPTRPACWVCAWGSLGAFALDVASGRVIFEAAHVPERVVDTLGAGDTFNAAYLHARLSGADAAGALRCACAVAGCKVGQVGFGELTRALPPELR